ncbi:hypothetical protein [Marinicellulosiphila megalodicopiae]|uniref:hypothetical protein n=1 Tax=Marinicellulosiphila megalodicopiae TaxID=2724896 RepID=UPI003BAFA1FD
MKIHFTILFSIFILYTSTNTFAESKNILIGAELSNSLLGEPVSDYYFESGKHDITRINETLLLGPTFEYLINSSFSIRASTQIQFKYKNIQAKNRTFSSFSVPIDFQGFYWINNFFKIGGGMNIITAHSLTDERPTTIEVIDSPQVTDTYQFKTSAAPIFTIQFHDWFTLQNNKGVSYIGLSYSANTFYIENYDSNMLLDQKINGDKFMITFGFSFLKKI